MKWTHEIRSYLYECLVRKFGPYSDWENAVSPKKGKDGLKTFKDYLEDLSKVLKNRFRIDVAPSAIQNQINWSVQNNKKIVHPAYFKTYIQNTYTALEQGFLTYKDLPTEASFILPHRENKAQKEQKEEKQTPPAILLPDTMV